MERYRRLTGRRMTYRQLAAATAVSESTLQSIAARPDYNTTLDTVDRIAAALDCPLDVLLERLANTPSEQPMLAAEGDGTTDGR